VGNLGAKRGRKGKGVEKSYERLVRPHAHNTHMGDAVRTCGVRPTPLAGELSGAQ
jgi:hypothetical protein